MFAFSWLAIILGAASLPEGVVWKALYGVSILCGIGFTMSLFIGSLALSPSSMGQMTDQRIAIIAGSLLSALFGYMLLKSPGASSGTEVTLGVSEVYDSMWAE